MVENSREIEKMFYQDSFGKKKIGSNVHRMSGKGKRNGVKGGVRFTNTFKKYERRSSKVKKGNLFENILPHEEFITYNDDIQKEMLEKWFDRYPKRMIKEEMNINFRELDKYMKKYNIEERRGVMRANQEDMEEFKNNDIGAMAFKRLPDDQKYEIVDWWQRERGMLNEDIAKKLDYKTVNTFNTRKSKWKKEYEKRKEVGSAVIENKNKGVVDDMSKFNDNFLLEGLDVLEKSTEDQPSLKEDVVVEETSQDVVIEENDVPKQSKVDANYDDVNRLSSDLFMEVRLGGTHNAVDLADKLEAIANLLNEDALYDVTVTISERK